MSLTFACCLILVFYGLLWFFDSFFKSCMHYPYYAFLQETGLKIGLLNFSWTTTAFNRVIFRTSKNFSRVLKKWFICGNLFTLWCFLPFALWTLISFIYENLNNSIHLKGSPEVKAMLPGVNIPISDFWIYFVAISLCTILHELGHAMAAAQEDVQLLAVGFHVFVIVPMAFVQFNVEHLNALSIRKRLRIFCAGVWHNACLASLALAVFLCSPILFGFAYDTDLGVKISEISIESPLYDARGLEKGDVVTSINGCNVKNTADWIFCLRQSHQRFGICTSASFIAKNDEFMDHFTDNLNENNVVECCGKNDKHSLCFEYMEPKYVGSDSVLSGQYFCLKPRNMISEEFKKCTEEADYKCPGDLHCLKPLFNKNVFMIVIERKEKFPVIYLGWPHGIYNTVEVDQYFPKSAIFSIVSPTEIEKLLRYIFVLSLGIGFLNVIPCYGTDGHYIAQVLIQIIAKKINKNNEFVSLITIITIAIGSCLTLPFLIYIFYKAVTEVKF